MSAEHGPRAENPSTEEAALETVRCLPEGSTHTRRPEGPTEGRRPSPRTAADIEDASSVESSPMLEVPAGGRTTISPPANVKLRRGEAARVLVSGYDSINLAIDVNWRSELFFHVLDELKQKAKASEDAVRVELCDDDHEFPAFNVKPHGVDGYEWLLMGGESSMKIGRWLKPQSRPSILVELRSETLWHQGPNAAVSRICKLLEYVGADVEIVKVSRADLAVDVLFRRSQWSASLLDRRVTRAVSAATYHGHRRLTGFSVGSGDLMMRMYDKPLEIATKSKKHWMYDFWGLLEVPDDHIVLRTEFQLRRQIIKELKINTFDDLMNEGACAWRYCTEKWIKFQKDPEKHHTQQETLPFWEVIQRGFVGAQDAHPLVRQKAMRANQEQILQQLFGQLSSLVALKRQGRMPAKELNVRREISGLINDARLIEMTNAELTSRVMKKTAKYRRAGDGSET